MEESKLQNKIKGWALRNRKIVGHSEFISKAYLSGGGVNKILTFIKCSELEILISIITV